MSGMLFHVGATAMCPHAGQMTVASSNTKVMVSGQPVATMSDTFTIAGCVFAPGGAAHPCVTTQWLTPATRVQVNGQPVILQTSSGLCKAADQAPQGAPLVVVTQVRVGGI